MVMIYAVLPLGVAHGWGICGRYLTRELAMLDEIRLITDRCDLTVVADELEQRHLAGLLPSPDQAVKLDSPGGCAVDVPVLQGVPYPQLQLPFRPNLRGSRNVG